MNKNINSIEDLANFGLLDLPDAQLLAPIVKDYKLAISSELISSIKQKNYEDPIFRQFVPDIREIEAKAYEEFDPIGDNRHTPLNGLVHRYSDRVLLKVTNNCPIYCRFCFRREMVGKPQSGILSNFDLDAISQYLRQNTQIKEVILTGGDPLMVSPNYLLKISDMLRTIPSIDKLRVHSRIVCAVPKLISQKMLDALVASQKKVRIALHINHANEISAAAEEKIKFLLDNKIELLSQSVLLSGVNANIAALVQLYNRFSELGIKPYYLHHPDLARGTSHFQIDFSSGMALFAEMRRKLPSEFMPRYVIDIPGGFGKVDVNEQNIKQLADKSYQIADRFGETHHYPNIL